MGTPNRSPIVIRMNRCSMLARVRSAARVMSCAAMPYVISRTVRKNRLMPRGALGSGVWGSFAIRAASNTVQIQVVVFGNLSLAQHPPPPRGDLRDEVGHEPQRIVRRGHREPDDIPHR